MDESSVHPDALTFAIREAMSLQSQCRDCSSGEVELHRNAGPANWKVSVLTGWGCGDCLIALLPLIEALKRRFPIADFDSANRSLDFQALMSSLDHSSEPHGT